MPHQLQIKRCFIRGGRCRALNDLQQIDSLLPLMGMDELPRQGNSVDKGCDGVSQQVGGGKHQRNLRDTFSLIPFVQVEIPERDTGKYISVIRVLFGGAGGAGGGGQGGGARAGGGKMYLRYQVLVRSRCPR